MEWRVSGADKATGIDKVLLVEADDEAGAVRQAGRLGLMVEGVRRNAAAPPAKSKSALWLTLLVVGAILAIGLGVYFMRPAKSTAKSSPSATASMPPVAGTRPTPNVVAVAQPKTQSTGSISGAAWLQKNDGDSSLMRGLHIYLGRPKFDDPTPVCRLISDSIPKWEALVDSNRQLATQCQDTIKQYGDPGGYSSKQLADTNQSIATMEERITEFRALVQQPPLDMSATNAYKILSNGVFTAGVGFPIESLAMMDCQASVDGKYSLANIPPGKYILFASFHSETTTVDWLLPIHVDPGQTQNIDLSNNNAIRVSNLH